MHKARGKQGRDQATKLMAEARHLLEMPAKGKAECASNLATAEEKAKQAASLNTTYSMWDFGDRPGQLIADVKKAREKEHLTAARPTEDLAEMPPVVKPAKGPRKVLLAG